MIPVMYHYVRPWANFPYFPYLHLDDFRRQLDWFEAQFGFVSRNAFCSWLSGGEAPEGVLLTFDDGLKDHVEFVLPLLKERGLFALFYIATAPFDTGVVLDVHKVHLAVGKLGGPASRAWLDASAPGVLSAALEKVKAPDSYASQQTDGETKRVKQFFNWCVETPERRTLLDGLLDHAFGGKPPSADDIYLDRSGLQALADAGMGVGPHGHNHRILSQLHANVQEAEIRTCCELVEQLGGSRSWGFCYPYGSRDAFDRRSEMAAAKAGCPFAFANLPGDIARPLNETRRFALPRHNCNSFAFGAASYDDRKRGVAG